MIRQVAIVVPAANEQDRIAACLQSIERARDHLLRSRPDICTVQTVVVLDACDDDTAEVAARFPGVHLIATNVRCVGATRQLGANHAIATTNDPRRLWLANTDADSEVPRNWLTHMVAEANTGADLVLGTVLPGAGLPRAVREMWLAQHQLRRGHPHVHGANFGIRADVHLSLGGWESVGADEDTGLAQRAVSAGTARIVRTASIPVVTSARLVGRAPHGFSSYLRQLHERQPVPD
jgi:glycosyltransferase involved in cell wall biosynthesis